MANNHSTVTFGELNTDNEKNNKKKRKRKENNVTISVKVTESETLQSSKNSNSVHADPDMNDDVQFITNINTPTNKKFRVEEDDDFDNKYKVENYITEQQIDDIINKSEKQNSRDFETLTYTSLNGKHTIPHNVVVNHETGETASVVRKELSNSLTPQYFYISPPLASSLEMIEEESNSGSDICSKYSIGTHTNCTEEEKQFLLNGYPLQCSNLNVKCSSDSVTSDLNSSSISSSSTSAFRDKYREVISNSKPSNVKNSKSWVNQNKNSRDILELFHYQNERGAEPFSSRSIKTNLSCSQSSSSKISTSSTSLSNYMNLDSTSSMESNRRHKRLEAHRRSYQDEVRALRKLCGLPNISIKRHTIDWSHFDMNNNTAGCSLAILNKPKEIKLQKCSSISSSIGSTLSTRTSSLNWQASKKLMSALKSSSVDKHASETFSSTSDNRYSSSSDGADHKFVGQHPLKMNYGDFSTSSQYSSRPSCRPTVLSTSSADYSDSCSTGSSRTHSNVQTRFGFAVLRNVPSRNVYSITSSDLRNRFSRKSHTSSYDDINNSLNELSHKFEAYLKNPERHHDISGHRDSSSDTGTDSTVRYIPEIVTSDCNETDYAYAKPDKQEGKVPTLKKLALMVVLSLKDGVDLLSDIYFVPPQKATHLNKLYTSKNTTCCRCQHEHVPRFIPRKLHEPWTKIQIPGCSTRVLLSPSQAKSISSPDSVDFAALLDCHKKFKERRGYYEHHRNETIREEVNVEGIYSPKTPKSCILNVDENYTKELLEEAANLLAVRKYREARSREDRKLTTTITGYRGRDHSQKRNLIKQQSDVLESIQNQKHFRTNMIDQIGNNVQTSRNGETKINTFSSPMNDAVVSSSTSLTVVSSSASVTNSATHKTKSSNSSCVSGPKSLTPICDEELRKKMYTEYMQKVAERFERRQKKVIRITGRPVSAPTMVKIFQDEVPQEKPCSLEEEFMRKARTRMQKLGISLEEQTCVGYGQMEVKEEELQQLQELPTHLQEFIQTSDKDGGEFVELYIVSNRVLC